jgi:hypothetical protein
MHSEAERRHNDDDNNHHHDHNHSHYKPHYDYSRQLQHDAKKVVRYTPLTAKAYSQVIEKCSHKKRRHFHFFASYFFFVISV